MCHEIHWHYLIYYGPLQEVNYYDICAMDDKADAQVVYMIYQHSCKEVLAELRFKLMSFNSCQAFSRSYDGPVDVGTQNFWPHHRCLYSDKFLLGL